MKFIVEEKVFSVLPTACFGAVVARGIDNRSSDPLPADLLKQSVLAVENMFSAARAREAAEIAPYREAFGKLGINPNKFLSSIEAMASRIEKKKGFPSINPIVDLGNALSLKYLLPMGAHDIDAACGDIQVRFSRQGDLFTPFGEEQAEVLEEGEDGRRTFRFIKGPVFCQLLMADEINRASPRTQSAQRRRQSHGKKPEYLFPD